MNTAATITVTGLATIGIYLYYSHRRRPRLVRRAAFDIGSGASKVVVADVHAATGVLAAPPVFEAERPCAFKADAQASQDGALSDAIRQDGERVIAALAARARAEGATHACGIATEVFRTAPNGLAFLEHMQSLTNVPFSILSQDEEARLGLATAEALAGTGAGTTTGDAAWDSGGGSFQISARAPGAPAGGGAIAAATLRTYVGKLGTGPSFERLVVGVRGQPYDPSPAATARLNPVQPAEAAALVKALQAKLPPPAAWLAGAHVVAIGAFNSIFAVTIRASRLLVQGKFNKERRPSPRRVVTTPGEEGASGNGTLTLHDARATLVAACNLDDAALHDVAGHGPDAEGPHLVVPKIALLVAVYEHLALSKVTYCRSTGGCAGLMALGEFAPL